MSTEREKIKELAYQIEEQYQKRQPAKDRTAPVTGAKFALMRSAGAIPNIDNLVSVTEQELTVVERKMRGYGCDFITASYLLMREHGCPSDARDFVQIMMGMLRGNQKQTVVLDDWISEFAGLSRATIIKKRQALKDWQNTTSICLIEIHEFPREKGTKHFKPNQYRDVYSDIVTKFAIHLSQKFAAQTLAEIKTDDSDGHEKPQLWGDMKAEKNSVAFPKRFDAEEVRNEARRFGEDFSHNPIQPRQKYSTSNNTTFAKKDLLDTIDAQIISAVAQGRDVARKRGISAFTWWSGVRQRVSLLIAEPTPGFPDPEEE